jgi:polyhydroxybutyrate depolymerase
MFSRQLALLGVLGAIAMGCGGNAPTSPFGSAGGGGTTSSAGTPGGAGNTTGSGTAGTGAAGTTTSGAAGSASGAAGSTDSGSAGSTTSGSAGDGGGQAGTGSATGGAGGTAVSGTGGSGTPTAGTTGAGGRPSGPSAGCIATVPNEPLGTAVLQEIDITGMAAKYVAGYTHRKYCTTIPKNYNPTQPYPVVFYGPGCGATACEGNSFSGRTDIFIVQGIAGADAKGANIVPPNGSPGCFQAGKESNDDSPEGPYFDQVMNQVEAKYCTDKGKIFAAGTSSGAWLSNYLACARGNRIRGTAADSGGLQFNHGTCTGGAAVMEMPGDSTEAKDQEGNEIGAGLARDTFIKLNGCSTTPMNMTFGSDACQIYGGCASPVVWCNVGGSHQSGNGHLSPTGWAFWKTLQ